MDQYKIFKLSSDSSVSKIVARKWIEVNDGSSGQYSVNKNIRFKTKMLRSDLYDYSDEGTAEGNTLNNRADKKLNLKKNTPVRSCISKIHDIFIVNAFGRSWYCYSNV